MAIPLSYIFGFVLDYGPQGIWYGLLVGLTIAAVALFLRFKKLAIQKSQEFTLADVT